MNVARTAVISLGLGALYLSLLRRPILTWRADAVLKRLPITDEQRDRVIPLSVLLVTSDRR